MILERLGKCEEALRVIRGPLGGINTVYPLCAESVILTEMDLDSVGHFL